MDDHHFVYIKKFINEMFYYYINFKKYIWVIIYSHIWLNLLAKYGCQFVYKYLQIVTIFVFKIKHALKQWQKMYNK